MLEADDIEAIPVSTPTDVLELMDADQTPTEIVTTMIRDAMAVADGRVPDIGVLRGKFDKAEELRMSTPSTRRPGRSCSTFG